MNTRNDRDLDDLLSDDAGRIGARYRKLGNVEPPRRLDRNVLAEASRAVHGGPRAGRWLLGLGTAAGVLLAAGIGWRVNHDMAQQREAMPMSAPTVETAPAGVIHVESRPDSGDKASDRDKIVPAENQPGVADAEASSSAASANGNAVERKAGQAKRNMDKEFVPDPAVRKVIPKPSRTAAGKQEKLREWAVPMSPDVVAQPATALPMQVPTPDHPRSAQSMAPSSRSEPAIAPAPKHEAEAASDSAADDAGILSQDDARRERSSSSTTEQATAEIGRIRALLRAGDHDAALQAFRQLRRQRPDLVLPEDLRALGVR